MITRKEELPVHLQKYIIEQKDSQYTALEQATWRYILRQLVHFLSQHAHESYVSGVEATGITIDRIPRISDISRSLSRFGWTALPVSGFLPPSAFMELQSLGVLPIAAEMRTFETLLYTPAPDIVHEAAGHAPILSNQEFSNYLRNYATVANKAIISYEDMQIYSAIRVLSDLKEHLDAKPEQIEEANKHLINLQKTMTSVSEASQLARMNWWTAEYGLIGNVKSPKIYGAGLLSSVGESKWCLGDKVRKIPFSLECIETSYDITEPQPQLFVTPSFEKLSEVLSELSETLAYKKGGTFGLKKAHAAKTVTTTEFDNGLQVSGILKNYILDAHGEVAYLQWQGPSQISNSGSELSGQGVNYHKEGFGSSFGKFLGLADKDPSRFNSEDLQKLGLKVGSRVEVKFLSGVCVRGVFIGSVYTHQKLQLLQFKDCEVTLGSQRLFEPSWGVYDMAVGLKVVSVFEGYADRLKAQEEGPDFAAHTVKPHLPTASEKEVFAQFQSIRDLREGIQPRRPRSEGQRPGASGVIYSGANKNPPRQPSALGSALGSGLGLSQGSSLGSALAQDLLQSRHTNWLAFLELYEFGIWQPQRPSWLDAVESRLSELSKKSTEVKALIDEGLKLAHVSDSRQVWKLASS